VLPRNLAELRTWASSHEGRKILRFTSVSVISTVVSNGVLFLVYGTKLIKNEIDATLFGNLVATLPSYNLNRRWTWGKTGPSHWRKEILPFWAMSSLGIAFSAFGGAWAKDVVHHHHWHHLVNTVLLMGFNLGSFAIFWVLKMLVFNRIFHTGELAQIDEHLVAEELGQH
jgi:putative flippase GtrA